MLVELNHADGAIRFQRGAVDFAHIVNRQTQAGNAVIERNDIFRAAERVSESPERYTLICRSRR